VGREELEGVEQVELALALEMALLGLQIQEAVGEVLVDCLEPLQVTAAQAALAS
jgi:hypothetical protein